MLSKAQKVKQAATQFFSMVELHQICEHFFGAEQKDIWWNGSWNEELTQVMSTCLEHAKAGKPLAYILGKQSFAGEVFKVTEGVLVPREDTQTLLNLTAEALVELAAGSKIIDVGTGSGCLGLSLAKRFPQHVFLLADISNQAIKTAKDNLVQMQLPNVHLLQMNWLEALQDQSIDVITSNPPYISQQWFQAHTQLHQEPSLALVGDLEAEPNQQVNLGGGKDCLHRIIQQASRKLKPEGWLFLEHGFDQSLWISEQLNQHFQRTKAGILDYNGLPRVSYGQKLK